MYFNHFSIREVLANTSQDERTECIEFGGIDSLLFLVQFLDSFRDFIDSPIRITSSYRDLQHNKLVGGVPTSQHCLGQAIDFKTPMLPQHKLINLFYEFLDISPLKIHIGQVIFYDSFIHIGLRTDRHPKLQIYDKRNRKNNH